MRTVMQPSFALLRGFYLTPGEDCHPFRVEPFLRLDQRSKLMIRFRAHLKLAAVIVRNPDDLHSSGFRRGDPGWSILEHERSSEYHSQARRREQEEIRLRFAALDLIT